MNREAFDRRIDARLAQSYEKALDRYAREERLAIMELEAQEQREHEERAKGTQERLF